ncbi:MAG: ATPase [Chloroflexi bacterium]|nr:MAG: ATPase [Chloroflexota bacterium]TMD50992.1 MAG: ATPase [Chloroflexota bacterium]
MNTTDYALEIVPGKQEIVGSRLFDAPRELVFKTMTDPTLIPRWWGPRRHATRVDEMEVRAGGRWRYVLRDPDGDETAFHGVYHDLTAPERLIYTFEWEGQPGHVLLETVTLEDVGGQTKMTDLLVFQSVADRDGMVENGMESGARETMDRLEELLTGGAS